MKRFRVRHRGLLLALALLTRLPVRLAPPPQEHEHGEAVAAYPLVGLLLGALLVALAMLGFWLGLPHGPLALLLFMALPYAREQGLGSAGARHLPRAAVTLTVTLAALAPPLLAGAAGLAMLVATALVCAAGVTLMRRRLGGFTGDTAGALVETVELAALLAAVLYTV